MAIYIPNSDLYKGFSLLTSIRIDFFIGLGIGLVNSFTVS